MVGTMMWFKSKPSVEKPVDNGVVSRLRKKKPGLLKPTRESSETSTESEVEKRRHSDILDMKVSLERRDESDESLYESADCHSDAISASDDAIPRMYKTPTVSKESLKVAVTDEETDLAKPKKTHRKTMSLSYPLEIVKNLGDEWFDAKKDSDRRKSRESLFSEEDRDSLHGSNAKLDSTVRKNSKKEEKSQCNSRKSSTEIPKPRKSSKSSVTSFNFLRRKKTPTPTLKTVDVVTEVVNMFDNITSTDEILNYTKYFLEEEKRHSSMINMDEKEKSAEESDNSDDEPQTPTPKPDNRRRLSRQTSRSKSKARGKSQSVKVNTLKKSHSGTLKRGKKKGVKTPLANRSRQASIADSPPIVLKKSSDSMKHNSWLFGVAKGEAKREGSNEEPAAATDGDADTGDHTKDTTDTANSGRAAPSSGRGVNRAESCRERDAPRRGKHRNASDPNRLTPHNRDLEPGAVTAPSGSSSSSSLSSRSNESSSVPPEQQASSDWSEEDEPLAAQWAESLPPEVLDSLVLPARLRKRQEVIHELIVSEGSHVRWLKVLGRVFLRPLEGAPSLLPADELRALFPNLPAVRERHAKLYSELRSIRSEATDHVVPVKPVANAMLNTLGDSGYALCLSRFCRGQRMALDALRSRRRKNKDLHQFLQNREQLPLCGRLQLKDLLACVWQRLTKYQLLLESILKTVEEDDANQEGGEADEILILRRALMVAKDVLHSVDTAIRTAENEHRLRSIQNKLEVRASGSEWDELRRLDLTQHSLRMEGELSIRNDSNKKTQVLALMLDEYLVLLHKEGDKFILRPISQPSTAQQAFLSPLIKWDKVLFRPNAAMRHTFFLMNINGVQMHELSAQTANEYSTWVKHIQECPLAKLTELKPILTPSHHPTKSNDDSGINVSRNPSDASEKSNSTAPIEEQESERDRTSLERSSTEREREESKEDIRRSLDKEDTPERLKRRQTVGRVCTHSGNSSPALESTDAVTVLPPAAIENAHVAEVTMTHQERLRRLDADIARALEAKSEVVCEVLRVPPHSFSQIAEMAVAETLGQVDVACELRQLNRSGSVEETQSAAVDMHQLLLAAQVQANQLTEALNKALHVDEAATVVARSGRCDKCRRSRTHSAHRESHIEKDKIEDEGNLYETIADPPVAAINKDVSFDMLSEIDAHGALVDKDVDDLGGGIGAAALASRLVGVTCGLQSALARLLSALPAVDAERHALRRELAALRDANDALRRRNRTDYPITEEISFPKENVDQTIKDQPSNGG